MTRTAGLCAATAVLSACTTVAPDGSSSRLHVGIVRVERPAVIGNTRVTDVKSLGLGWDQGLWLGWKSDSWIAADPSKCQLLVIIRSAAEADNAARVLRSMKGMQPCLVDYTRSAAL